MQQQRQTQEQSNWWPLATVALLLAAVVLATGCVHRGPRGGGGGGFPSLGDEPAPRPRGRGLPFDDDGLRGRMARDLGLEDGDLVPVEVPNGEGAQGPQPGRGRPVAPAQNPRVVDAATPDNLPVDAVPAEVPN